MRHFVISLSLCVLLLGGCQTASDHAQDVNKAQDKTDSLSVASVQRKVSTGMSGAAVIEVLGSPNIISTDEQRREVWVYDKISSSTVYSESSGGVNLLIIGGGSRAGAVSTTQKSLTVIIKFDENSRVRDFAYHTSQF